MSSGAAVPRTLVYLELRLDFLIASTGNHARIAKRRLNALENTIAALARPWRPDVNVPISPSAELRMHKETILRWIMFVDEEETEDPKTVERLAEYASGALTEDDVPKGWVRLLIRQG